MSATRHYCLRCYRELDLAAAAGKTPGAGTSCANCGTAYDSGDERTFVSFDGLSLWATYLLAFLVLVFGSGFILISYVEAPSFGLPAELADLDKNRDGKLSEQELPPGEDYSAFDFNSDNMLDGEEADIYLQTKMFENKSVTRQQVGWTLVLGLPICMGAVLGYTSSPRRFRTWQKVIIAILMFCGFMLLLGLLSVYNIAPLGPGIGMGMFCMVMLGLIFILPFMLGDWLGYVLRRRDERKKRNWKWVRVVVFLLLPFGLDAAERLVPRGEDLASVETRAVFQTSQEEAWNAIVFFEQMEQEPPFLLRLALPRPVGTTGSKAGIGDTSRCEYENGYLVKKITEREEGRVLGFRVIKQKLHFEHDLELREGSFRLEPGPGPGTTLVTLATTYRRLTYPAFIWQPAETLVLHTLHEHVLEGMRINAEKEITVEPGLEIPGPVGRVELPGLRDSSNK